MGRVFQREEALSRVTELINSMLSSKSCMPITHTTCFWKGEGLSDCRAEREGSSAQLVLDFILKFTDPNLQVPNIKET